MSHVETVLQARREWVEGVCSVRGARNTEETIGPDRT